MKSKITIWIVLSTIFLFFGGLYLKVIFEYTILRFWGEKYLGDIFYHLWISKEVISNGTVPLTELAWNVRSIYSFHPAFHILNSIGSLLTQLNFVEFASILNVLIILFLILGTYLLSYSIFKNKLVSVLTSLLFLTVGGSNFIWYVPSFIELLYLRPSKFAFFLLLISLSFLLKFLEESDKKILDSKVFVIFILFLAIIFYHNITFINLLIILFTFIILISVYYPQKRKSCSILFLLLIASLFIFLITNLEIFSGGYPIINEFRGDLSGIFTDYNLVGLTDYFGYFLVILCFIGLLFYFKNISYLNDLNFTGLMLMSWFVSGILLTYQGLLGYIFFPDRFLKDLLFPLSVFASFAIYNIIKIKENYVLKIITIVLIILILFSPVISILTYKSMFHGTGINAERYDEIKIIGNNLENSTILTDPFTGYILISLTNLKIPFEFERNKVSIESSKNLDIIKILTEKDEKKIYSYSKDNNVQYIILSWFTLENYDININKFDNDALFEKINLLDKHKKVDFFIYKLK